MGSFFTAEPTSIPRELNFDSFYSLGTESLEDHIASVNASKHYLPHSRTLNRVETARWRYEKMLRLPDAPEGKGYYFNPKTLEVELHTKEDILNLPNPKKVLRFSLTEKERPINGSSHHKKSRIFRCGNNTVFMK